MSKTAAKQKRIKEKQAKDIHAQLPSRNLRLELALIAIIVLLAFGARYIGLMDAGITYDEPNYILSGNLFVSNWAHLDFSESAWSAIYEHPPVSRYIYGTAISLLGTPLFDYNAFINAKLASALMGALTCVIVYLLGRDFFGRKVGITSALILSFIPVFMAHTQIAALESPLALFFTLTIYLFMAALQRDSGNYFILSALAFGLTLGTKFNGILLLPLLALIFAFFTLQKAEGSGLKAKADNVVRNIGSYVPVDQLIYFIVIVIAVFYLIWPWIWANPIGHLQLSLSHWAASPAEYFLGTLQSAPIYYYPVYFAVTTPLLLFIPMVIGFIAIARSKDAFKIGILVWLAVPFLYGFSPFVQDGMRYLIMIYPAIALICGYGLWAAAGWIGDRVKSAGRDRAFAVGSALTVVYLVVSLILVHPYYLDYYNALAGGPKGAYEHRSYEFGWWGEGVKAAIDYVERTAEPGSAVFMITIPDDSTNTETEEGDLLYFYSFAEQTGIRDRAFNFTTPVNASYRLQQAIVIPAYVITNAAAERYLNDTVADGNYTLVHEVTVQGATLAKVYKRTAPIPENAMGPAGT